MTVRVSIAQLKARLSEFLGVVREGEDVIVTDRGKPVARLTRVTGDEAMEAHVEELVRAGLARPPERPLDEEFYRLPRPADPAGRAVRAILEEREEGP
jgi:prevent-host-death family protein